MPIDEFDHPVDLSLICRNILIGGEPGAGKSSLLNAIIGLAALSGDVSPRHSSDWSDRQ